MEEASLLTTRKHLFIFTQYYDKHGVPPTKRLFKVAMLDPSPEFIGHWGMFGDLGRPLWIKESQLFRKPAYMEYTQWVFCKRCGKPIKHHRAYLTKRYGFRPRFFHRIVQTTIGYLNLSTCLWMIRGGETMSDSVFKHDLCKLVIAKMGFAITYDCTRGTESGEERFKKFANNSGVIGGERFCFNPF
ncbi:hypothetical protein Tco_0403590 [Tanacetum coccineum]